MSAVISVCAWCNRRIEKDKKPGERILNHKYNPDVSYGCCSLCDQLVRFRAKMDIYLKQAQDEAIEAFRQRVERQKELVLSRN